MSPWRPTPFLVLSFALQALALLALLWRPDFVWAAVAVVFVCQLAITAVGLWPRSTWLGPNLVRLPASAAQRGEVAITIDDGPDPQVTPQVLDILAAHGAQASFFCVGELAAAQPELCRRMRAAGHRLENHGLRHRWHESFLGYAGWLREIGAAQQRITEAAGQAPRYFRAMAGLRNPFLEPALRRLGLQLASWTRRGFDTRTGDPELVLRRLLGNVERPLETAARRDQFERGVEVLLHVGPEMQPTAGHERSLGMT